MRVKTQQIVWHGKEPVYSLDFHPDGTLVTGGGDKDVRLWAVARGADGHAVVRHLGSLPGHGRSVNCVRFSPSGCALASAGDGGELLLWAPAPCGGAPPAPGIGDDSADGAPPAWRRAATLRGHSDDVMDLAWSPDGTALLSASIDNKAVLWDVPAGGSGAGGGKMAATLAAHRHFVQGVAWDPFGRHLVTQSADRTARVYSLRAPAARGAKSARAAAAAAARAAQPAAALAKDFYCSHTLAKRPVAPPPGAPGGEAADAGRPAPAAALFADEAAPTMFRRPAWSPDGGALALPTGCWPLGGGGAAAPAGAAAAGGRAPAAGRVAHTAFVYARGDWAAPRAHFPQARPVVAARFCPVLFEPLPPAAAGGAPPAVSAAPYRTLLALATLDSVAVYDASAPGGAPLAAAGPLHYDAITDLAWSRDGGFLAVSSRDGYVSVLAFADGELGTPAPAAALPPHVARLVAGGGAAAAAGATPSAGEAVVVSASLRPEGEPPASARGSAQKRPAAAAPAADGAKKPKRIVAEPVPAPAAAAPAAAPAVPAAVAVQDAPIRKRIAPERIAAPAAAAPAAAAAAPESAAEPAPSDAGAAERKAKRITPTPLRADDAAAGFAEGRARRAPAPSAAAASEVSSHAAAGGGGRRITPIPVAAPPSSAAPEAAAAAPEAAAAAARPLSIAERAALAGAAAAAAGGGSRAQQ